MEKKDLEQKVFRVVADFFVLPEGVVSWKFSFSGLPYLDWVSFSDEIERLFPGIEISSSETKNLRTVGDLVDFLARRLGVLETSLAELS